MLKLQILFLAMVSLFLTSCGAQVNQTPLSNAEKSEAEAEILELMEAYQDAEAKENVAKILNLTEQTKAEGAIARSVMLSTFNKYDIVYKDTKNVVSDITRNTAKVRVSRKQIRKEGPSDIPDVNAVIEYGVVYVNRDWKIKTVNVLSTVPLQ